jgi:hypothetical protein
LHVWNELKEKEEKEKKKKKKKKKRFLTVCYLIELLGFLPIALYHFSSLPWCFTAR